MDDEVIAELTRPIDIPARFIRQAYELIQRSGTRYVPFRFTGERVGEAVCVGVGGQPLLTDQRPPEPAAGPTSTYTVETLTTDVVLGFLLQQQQPMSTRQIGDALGTLSDDVPVRQKLRRVLVGLVDDRMLRRSRGPGHFPHYAITDKAKRTEERAKPDPESMPLRTPHRRAKTRNDITEDVVVNQIRQTGRISSRGIGDALGIPRPDTSVRGKITERMAKLVKEGRVQDTGTIEPGGGKLYELVEEASAQAG